MPKKIDTFEFPHGGRRGMDFDFDQLLDGGIWQLEKGVDFPTETSAETFLGALSRYANKRDLRVNKHVDDEGNIVTVRVRPKKVKEDTGDEQESKPATRSRK